MITDDEDSAQTLAVAVNKLTRFNSKTLSQLSFDNETVEVLAVQSGDVEGNSCCIISSGKGKKILYDS